MNKLLISLLSLTGVVGLSTGGYFLLRGNSTEESKQNNGGEVVAPGTSGETSGSGAEAGAGAPKTSSGGSNPGFDSPGSAVSGSPQTGAQK